MEEKWEPIENFEEYYLISNMGNVKSLRSGKILKVYVEKDGYRGVWLYKPGCKKYFRIHRLVATAFIPNPDNKPCVDHINTDKSKNEESNLRWVTYKENSNNPLTRYNISRSQKEVQNRPEVKLKIRLSKDRSVYRVTTNQVYQNISDASKKLGIAPSTLCLVCNGKYRTKKYPEGHTIKGIELWYEDEYKLKKGIDTHGLL